VSSRIDDLLTAAAARLREAGVESPRREARLMLAHALSVSAEALVSGNGAAAPPESVERFQSFVTRRARREPLAYILGTREFWSLNFAVGPGVLVPRPESETLVEEALRCFPSRDAPLKVLDLGTGSGCLLLAFLSERPQAQGLGVDISDQAHEIAAENAGRLGLTARANFVRGNWLTALSGAFDVVFANPPYIAEQDLAQLDPEVARYEPKAALDGGPDGLDAYRAIATDLAAHLRPGGQGFLEVGRGQAAEVQGLFAKNGLVANGTVFDLAGILRCLVVGAGRERIPPKKGLAIATRSG
jgi:release factor glutamine methyltransferase